MLLLEKRIGKQGQFYHVFALYSRKKEARPLIGTFAEGIGTFFQVIETPDGHPLQVRFIWDELTGTTARWQQAFSFDGRVHWETNWVMQFTKEP